MNRISALYLRAAAASLGFLCTIAVSGCGADHASTSVLAVPSLQGRARGGQQPISNAHVYFYAASQSGYGQSSISELSSPGYAITDAGGSFNITTQNTCHAGEQMYLLALGGNPGLSSGANNVAIAEMAALGPCESLTSATFINMSEVTTVAAAFALAPFMIDGTHLGTSATNVQGLTTAFANANNLADFSTGTARVTTPAGNGTVPQAELNTLANVLAACVNTDGTGTPCSSLFTLATPGGGTAPTDTLTAALNIAQAPTNHTAALFALAAANAPFQPSLATAPSDWSVAVSFTAALTQENNLAIDALGNVWVASYGNSTISEVTGSGTILFTDHLGGGLAGPYTISIDLSGNAWIADPNANNLAEFSSTGVPLSGSSGFTGGGLNDDVAAAIDSSGQIWTANQNNSNLSKFNSDGTPVAGSPISGSLNTPSAIAIDGNNAVWVGNKGDGSLVKFNNDGTQAAAYTTLGLSGPTGIAFDSLNNVWIASYYNHSVFKVSNSGTLMGIYGNGINGPYGIAIDGAGCAWVENSYSSNITKIDASGNSTLYGIPGVATSNPRGIEVDAAGSVWMGNSDITLLQFVGAAAPAVTPLSLAIKNGKLGARP